MRRTTIIIATVVCSLALGVATNVGSAALPDDWGPYLWLAWPLALLGAAALIVLELRRDRPAVPAALGAEDRYRRTLLGRVDRYWVRSVLEGSLYHEARIELGFETVQQQGHPWDVTAARSGGVPQPQPAGRTMSDLFDTFDEAIVIIGAPGSGKTTMLLELARDLLARANADSTYPAPVVLNLSSWVRLRKPVAEWLADELTERYGMPRELSARWVAEERLLPLLDGLDEVAPEYREACVAAINTFRRTYGAVPLAVCCRTEEHDRLDTTLRLYARVIIQPLSQAQIGAFLDRAGTAATGIRAALDADPGLWDLIDSPLLLSIVALAHADRRGRPAPEPRTAPEPGTTDAPTRGRQRLYTTYVRTMLTRRPNPNFPPAATVRHLAALGGNLRRRSLTVFTIDTISARWSSGWLDRQEHAAVVTSTAAGLLLAGLGYPLLGVSGAAVGVVCGLLILAGHRNLSYDGASYLAEGRSEREGDRGGGRLPLLWASGTWDNAVELLRAPTGLGVVAGGGAAIGALLGWPHGGFAMAGYTAVAAVTIALLWGAVDDLLLHLHWIPAPRPDDGTGRVEVPSPLMRMRLRGSLLGVVIVAVLAGTAAAAAAAVLAGADAAQRVGAFTAVGSAVFVLTETAFTPMLEQWLIRRALARKGVVPLPYLPFLDHCVRCLILRQVGDGYIFVHRELLDFFADCWPDWRTHRSRDDERATAERLRALVP
ncbi:NACHT domain-containing protein [Solwaraspora sp. WMMD1047]|uniref:NACHT domain-containing protein n=1 Tax=Solwaraspora sp. WMMD1047 TaxID=3016102 RepID=UPI00241615D8|nr:NACHT domain-containing protein [Solwaraspora sp. WMMD1047]MDG4832015.1 NACHT domain-containing protein [Solwaraspora sp. WMMD1047]